MWHYEKGKTTGLKTDRCLPRIKGGVDYKENQQGKLEVNATILYGAGVFNT